ncbi:hypothetical protein [Bacillus thuringiensis]|uniref:hypothetical protein n=2 Tax=Bacillus TaxID=1386 RepID=UPI000BF499E5|nr:hypothetical protein [Bacillus thuringiensis]PFL05000.1 hypothetical protein COJ28_24020 [Bacillus thuringiensis]PGV73579.1 hypothetical protein COD83_24525 [Bacillus thuringiensis]HDR4683604.1 hypothetical protein [Bacillus cereus]
MVMDFEKEAMQARLDHAEDQINKRLKEIESARAFGGTDTLFLVEEINLCLLLSTITGKPNKYIEF